MSDRITFNDGLSVVGVTPATTNLTGNVTIDYDAHAVSGTLNLSAAGTLGAQVYNNLSYTQTGTTAGSVPIYRLTGTNNATKIVIDYTGQLPTTIAANVTGNALQNNLASGSGKGINPAFAN